MLATLAGGVGAARFLAGLVRVVPAAEVVAIVNTADDDEFHGLYVSPDLDSVTYTLAGASNVAQGWGLEGETFATLDALDRYDVDTWFRLGDKDLATHIERTRRLRSGESLSSVTRDLGARLGVRCSIVPMSDDPVRTMVTTDKDELAFQDWFVRLRCEPVVKSVRFAGAEKARPHPALLETGALRGVVVCPSNPFVSVAPILAVPGVQAALARAKAPKVAVTPIVGGQAIKGPAAKMLAELGHDVSALGVARYYREWVDGFVLDAEDGRLAPDIEALGLKVKVADTMMRNDADKRRLARDVLEFVDELTVSGRHS